MTLINKLFHYVLLASSKFKIDDSHGLSHSMNILHYANQIYESEIKQYPYLKNQERLIYTSAVLHDMADKKYINENIGLTEIEDFLKNNELICDEECEFDYSDLDYGLLYEKQILELDTAKKHKSCIDLNEINMIKTIISTMSYSTVKKNGYPNLGGYQRAYHIVREADLLTAYDFDRSIIFNMNCRNADLKQSVKNAEELFKKRVLQHNQDGLFITDYSKKKSIELHQTAIKRIKFWRKIIQK
jgi:hypothetical protein